MGKVLAGVEPHDWRERLARGEILYDADSKKVGVVQWREPGSDRFWLRPVGGGYEWAAPLVFLYPATQEQEIRAKVAAANRQSRANEWEIA